MGEVIDSVEAGLAQLWIAHEGDDVAADGRLDTRAADGPELGRRVHALA